MVRIDIGSVEFYPYYFTTDTFTGHKDVEEIDIEEKKFLWIKKIMDEHQKVQTYLRKVYNENYKKPNWEYMEI